jgi:hypothetical protein
VIRYLKITLVDGTRFILRVTGESPLIVRGIEVNDEGDEVIPPGAHQRIRIIERALIKKAVEMRMSPKYATLEPVSRSTKKTSARLDSEIAEALGRRNHR